MSGEVRVRPYVVDYRHAKPGKCRARVLKRDTYRIVRDGKRRFAMHYTECQCQRAPDESGYCWQHRPQEPSDAR